MKKKSVSRRFGCGILPELSVTEQRNEEYDRKVEFWREYLLLRNSNTHLRDATFTTTGQTLISTNSIKQNTYRLHLQCSIIKVGRKIVRKNKTKQNSIWKLKDILPR